MVPAKHVLQAAVTRIAVALLAILNPGLLPAAPPERPAVRLTEDAVDESAGRLPAFKIETAAATYFLEKTGGGISSLIDRDGNDWISFHPRKGSGPGGEFRGFPNAVHQQAGNYFHPRNANTDPMILRVIRVRPDYVAITARSKTGHWAGRYEFYATHCAFTMTRVPAGRRYWVLYEGTPGGELEPQRDFLVRSDGKRRSLAERWSEDLPDAEWLFFADGKLVRSLFLLNHVRDDAVDSYYPMGKPKQGMTVFGFGRRGINKLLSKSPRRFSIGLVESRDPGKMEAIVKAMRGSDVRKPPEPPK